MNFLSILLTSSIVFTTELVATNTPKTLQEKLDTKYTTQLQTKKVFMQGVSGLNYDEQDQFMLGFSFYRIPWVEAPAATTARDGLGPLFNANTCISCHPNNALGSVYTNTGSISRAYVMRLSIPSDGSKEHNTSIKTHGFVSEPTYGGQLSVNGVHGVPYEGKPVVWYEKVPVIYPDGKTVILSKPRTGLQSMIKELKYGPLSPNTSVSQRLAPALVGLGLLEKITDTQILENEDLNDSDNDGISGKANMVFSPEFNDYRVGRYTWKASVPTLLHQVAAAAHNDMGLTNPLFDMENCTTVQKGCKDAPRGDNVAGSNGLDLPMKRVEAITFYLKNLKIPKSTISEKRGETLFRELDCVKCHTPSFTVGDGYTIKPFTDMLLHDMGEGLADGRVEFQANGNEWRTAPLWGIGKYKLATSKKPDFLHDGRAKTVEEAILWHSGEAQASKNAFMQLPTLDREAVLSYINEL